MGAPILWTPGKMRSFCRKTHGHKIPRFRGGGYFGFWGGGGGSADFIFLGARIFLSSGCWKLPVFPPERPKNLRGQPGGPMS